MQTPRTEFAQALHAIAQERGLDPDVILDTIKQAIIAAYKRDARERGEETEVFDFDVELNPTNGEARVFAWPLVPDELDEEGNSVIDPKELEEKREEAKKEKKDVTPPGFGRIAAQTAKQVIHQKIREAEKGIVMDEYSERIGGLITGMILRFDGPDVRVDLGRTEGLMPKEERVPNERLNANQRLSFLLKDIKETPKGKLIILSRADPLFVQELFKREVPEISSGSVEVKGIAREAGVRTKMVVFSNQSGVDPVGSCVGQKGVRVQAVTNELGGERVDIIPYTESQADLVKSALAPAEGLTVVLDEKAKTAKVSAPDDQLSLAIGRDGQNARLVAKLTGWKIEIKEIPGEKVKTEDKKEQEVEDDEKVQEKGDETPEAKEKVEPQTENEKAEQKDAVISEDASSQSQTDDSNTKTDDVAEPVSGAENKEKTDEGEESKPEEDQNEVSK